MNGTGWGRRGARPALLTPRALLPAEHVPAGPAAAGGCPEGDPGGREGRRAQEGAWLLPPQRGNPWPGRPHTPLTPLSSPQDRHLPLSFHRRQEELKFSLGLQRLQHRIHEIQALRERSSQLRDGSAGEGPGRDGSDRGARRRTAAPCGCSPVLMGPPRSVLPSLSAAEPTAEDRTESSGEREWGWGSGARRQPCRGGTGLRSTKQLGGARGQCRATGSARGMVPCRAPWLVLPPRSCPP